MPQYDKQTLVILIEAKNPKKFKIRFYFVDTLLCSV